MSDEKGYVAGFVAPVLPANREAYLEFASAAAAIFREYGATRVVECWGDDVPEGEVTDFRRAVKAEADENVVFSWIVWPSKAVCKAGEERMRSDPRFEALGAMPFDGKRMFWGGFEIMLDSGA